MQIPLSHSTAIRHLQTAVIEAFQHAGIARHNTLVIACSGGLDSVMLVRVLHSLAVPFVIAHVNYGLRGEESERDQHFVQALAQELDCSLELLSAHQEIADHRNIQSGARSIRYRWFRELMQKHGAAAIAVAHHRDDQVETLIHQFIRGGGPSTLTGMGVFTHGIFRPFLSLAKEELLHAAEEMKWSWVEDSSNAGGDYTRNQIRHHLRPALLQINAGLDNAIVHRSGVLREWLSYAEKKLEQELQEALIISGDEQWLSLSWLQSHHAPRAVIHLWLQAKGFDTEEAFKMLSATIGAQQLSGEWALWREANRILLCSTQQMPSADFEIDTLAGNTPLPSGMLQWAEWANPSLEEMNANCVAIDASLHPLPWRIRSWKAGDRFKPLGMQGTQTIGDFLTHQGVPARLRQNVLVLEISGQITWVIGHRVSEDFRFDIFCKQPIRFQYLA